MIRAVTEPSHVPDWADASLFFSRAMASKATVGTLDNYRLSPTEGALTLLRRLSPTPPLPLPGERREKSVKESPQKLRPSESLSVQPPSLRAIPRWRLESRASHWLGDSAAELTCFPGKRHEDLL